MKKQRVKITLEVECDREMVPGAFYNPQEFGVFLERNIKEYLISYNPSVQFEVGEAPPRETKKIR